MTTLPVVQRELIVAGRQPWTYHTRVLAAVLLALLGGVLLILPGRSVVGMTTLPLLTFKLLSSTVFAGCLLGGVLLTSDSIVSERRTGTLGLLFLTELGSLDVTFGKLSACAVQGLCALLGTLPILALPLMMGGVSWTAFWTACLLLISTFACSAGIGLWASARSRSTAGAYSHALLVIVLLCTLPPLAAWLAQGSGIGPAFVTRIDLLSPVTGLARAWSADATMGSSILGALLSASSSALYGAMALAAAALELSRTGRTGFAPDRTKPGPEGVQAAGTAASAPLPLSLTSYARQYLRRIPQVRGLDWIFRLGLVAFGCFQFAAFIAPKQSLAIPLFITAMLIAYALHVVFKIRTALAAVGPWLEEIQQGGLELLLCTPVNPTTLRRGRREAVRYRVHDTRRLLVAVNLLLCLNIFDPELDLGDAPIRIVFLAIFLGGIASLWADAPAIENAGVLHALKQRKIGTVLARTLLPILLPPWITALGVFILSTYNTRESALAVWFVTFHIAHLLVSGWVALKSGKTLDHRFRLLAHQRLGGGTTGGGGKTVSP